MWVTAVVSGPGDVSPPEEEVSSGSLAERLAGAGRGRGRARGSWCWLIWDRRTALTRVHSPGPALLTDWLPGFLPLLCLLAGLALLLTERDRSIGSAPTQSCMMLIRQREPRPEERLEEVEAMPESESGGLSSAIPRRC